ncbi:hypothetical protein ACB092_M002700 [Castanea dentata]
MMIMGIGEMEPSTSSTTSEHFCLPHQSSALLQLTQEFVQKRMYFEYDDYYNGSYPKMKSWKADSDCCSWDGVTCDTQNGVVIGLHLSNSWLNGPLNCNSSLFSLRHLRKLNLAFNNFTSSTIPSEFGQLIQAIDLMNNPKLVGFLPKFQSCSSLKELRLHATNFSGEFPNSISSLGSLSLTYLSLKNNNFHGQLPSTFGNLAKLTSMELDNNLFYQELTNITKLSFIDLSGNQLKGPIPSEISRLPNLFALILSQNSLTEAIPSDLFTIPSLSILVLDQNQLPGRLKFQNISSSPLYELILSENRLNESIPRSIANCTKLKVLYLSSINLKGKVELNIFLELKELCGLHLLGDKVFVSKANLPEFPDFLNAQNDLQILDLSNNNTKGKIPKWFWNVGSLNLSFNLLSKFEQPLLVLPWKNMQTLDLSSNMLQESFPILPLSTNYYFSSKNNLTRGIPPTICKVHALQILDVSNNQLIGQIPQLLVMRNNHFQGNLPEMFINGCSLKTLDLNHNQIQGQIPLSLVKCQMLGDLNLGNNKLNDTFPFWLVSLLDCMLLTSLITIFSSKLPSEYFQNWSAILGFTGKDKSQPRYMGGDSNYYKDLVTIVSKGQEMELVKNLTIFTTIDLSNNRFYGEIPNSMGNLKALILISLTFLEYLNLSQNQLTGPIPQGGQFLTFQSSSFEGNSRLPTSEMKHESSLGEGFGWKVVVIGYTCGLVIGLLTQHVVTSRRTDWLVRNFGVNLHR